MKRLCKIRGIWFYEKTIYHSHQWLHISVATTTRTPMPSNNKVKKMIGRKNTLQQGITLNKSIYLF